MISGKQQSEVPAERSEAAVAARKREAGQGSFPTCGWREEEEVPNLMGWSMGQALDSCFLVHLMDFHLL